LALGLFKPVHRGAPDISSKHSQKRPPRRPIRDSSVLPNKLV